MFRHYFRSAFRYLLRNKSYAAINIGGMAIGLTAFWLIALYVGDEWSYDRYHPKGDRIYRVAHHASWDGGHFDLAVTSAPFAPALKNRFPEIEQACRFVGEGGGSMTVGDKTIKEDNILFADSNALSVFDYTFIAGDPHHALDVPNTIVLTESLATTLFGDPSAALDKTVMFDNNFPVTVSGIIKDIPTNTHLHFSALRSMPAGYTGGWQQFQLYTYLLLKPNTNVAAFEKKLPAFAAATIKKEMNVPEYNMELQPIKDIHLHSNLGFESGVNSTITRVYIFMAIAALVLLIAIINYMNLSTARSTARIKEIGVRKVIGSGRGHLSGLFISEALLVTFLSAGIAFTLVTILLPFFNHLSGKELSIWRFGTITTLLIMVTFSLIAGTLSGLYPAIFLSRFKTIPSLKGQMGSLTGNLLLRRSLVVFQFVITVFMIASSAIIYQQLKYAMSKDLGFNKDQVLTFHIDKKNVRQQVSAIKSKLLQSPLIESVGVAGNPIGNNNLGGHGFWFQDNNGETKPNSKLAQELMTDADFLPTMQITLQQGRNFSKDMPADKYGSILINETLLKELGWKEPIGKKAYFRLPNDSIAERTVIGVIKDFHTYSLQHKVNPLVLIMPPVASEQDNLYVRIKKGSAAQALAYIETAYKTFDSESPVEFHFLDQNFAAQYAAEEKQQELSLLFTILAISIACLGLFGLAAFTARQRVKEIGIRKVLGASISSITTLLSRDYVILVAIAICIATPVTWIMMNKWLEAFAYRTTVQWWLFGIAGIVALFIALATVSIHAIKAALANPVKSLKNE